MKNRLGNYKLRLHHEYTQKLINEVKKINWKGYKLYLVGGIIENKWDSKDIDFAVVGNKVLPHLKESLTNAILINPIVIDIHYRKKVHNSHQSIHGMLSLEDRKFAVSMERYKIASGVHRRFEGEWGEDGLFWVSPTYLNEKKQKRNYTEEPILIYDGNV
jgi:tRNA nucleotidyltransferase/poly(A) polymerase